MFARLLKQQLKSTYKIFNILYASIIILGLLLGLSFKIETAFTIIMVVFVYSIFGVLIFYIANMLKICSTSLYGKRGYLTFCIPVSPHHLIISKILTIFLYGFGLTLSVIIAIFLASILISPKDTASIFGEIGSFIQTIFSNPLVTIISFINYFVSFTASLMLIFFAFALANTGIFNKKRSGMAVLIFIGINIVLEVILSLFADFNLSICVNIYDSSKLAILTTMQINNSGEYVPFFSFTSFFINLLSLIGFYFGTIYLMKNKLELK